MRRARLAAVAVIALPILGATPVLAAGSTTTTAAPKPTTAPAKSSPTTVAGPKAPTTTTTTVPSEIPPDEAELAGLLANVQARLAQLADLISSLDARIASNQSTLAAANQQAAAAQAAAYNDDRKLDQIEIDRAAARMSVRDRAIAAYMHQPTNDLTNMFLHLQDPAELVDVRSFYRSIVDTQVEAINAFNKLDKDTETAAAAADKARDAAEKIQAAVAKEQADLEALRQTLQGIEVTSEQQQQQENSLQQQLGHDKAQFEAELAAQAEESASITDLLQSLSEPGEETPSTPSPGNGYFQYPIPGAPITQRFGPNHDPFTGAPGFHPGVDFGASQGTPIHAAGTGKVVFAGQESGYGNYTCIDHGNEIATCYGHQSQLLVQTGQQVVRGQIIGLVGSTGYSTGPHLHFEVRINGNPVDPLPWLSNNPTSTTSTSTPARPLTSTP